MLSLPTWERGLKFICDGKLIDPNGVAPYVGAWIEIKVKGHSTCPGFVAPYVGAWIEISMSCCSDSIFDKSLPTWERGLKLWYRWFLD